MYCSLLFNTLTSVNNIPYCKVFATLFDTPTYCYMIHELEKGD